MTRMAPLTMALDTELACSGTICCSIMQRTPRPDARLSPARELDFGRLTRLHWWSAHDPTTYHCPESCTGAASLVQTPPLPTAYSVPVTYLFGPAEPPLSSRGEIPHGSRLAIPSVHHLLGCPYLLVVCCRHVSLAIRTSHLAWA